ncbi:ankyrin repeat-containing domain protein, partial [Lentinula raphanica]
MTLQYPDVSKDKEKKLIDWLAAPDCSANFVAASDKRVTGTGKWVLEDPIYLDWLKKDKGSILWIQGKGIIHTVIILKSSIISNLAETQLTSLVVYHYFDTCDNTQAKRSFRGLLLSLLAQMGTYDCRIHPALENLYKSSKHGLIYFKPTNVQLIDTLIKIINDSISEKYQIYIAIDALDECEDMDQFHDFLIKMEDFYSLRILISSRNTCPEDIKYFIISLNNNQMLDKDIAIFVDHSTSYKDTLLKAEVQKTLEDKADGGFYYIDCQLQYLKKCATVKAIRVALTQLPSDLENTYIKAMQSCEKSPHSEDANRLLLWLLYAYEPLSLNQVAIILSVDLDLKTFDLNAKMLNGLERVVDTTLVTVGANNIVQFAHASVKEFLLENYSDKQSNKLWNINTQLSHNIISQICLIYLLQQKEYRNIWLDSEANGWKIQQGNIRTFEQYATEHWANHCRFHEWDKNECENIVQLELTKNFLENKFNAFLNWGMNFRNICGNQDWLSGKWHHWNGSHAVAFFGLKKSAQRLLTNMNQRGAVNADTLGSKLETPLQLAAYMGNKDIVRLFLENDANVNAQAGHCGFPLYAAAFRGHKEIIELLLQNKADIDAQDRFHGSAIQAAAAEGYKDIIELLLKNGADVNAQGGPYESAIQAAAARGHTDVVELLYNNGANINSQNGCYGSAIQAAAFKGHINIVKFLLENGADANSQGG